MDPGYWFPAKRYGWGWGPPTRWQGWAVLAVYVLLFVGDFVLFPLDTHTVTCIAGAVGLQFALIAVCWWKGEPPRWRWGD